MKARAAAPQCCKVSLCARRPRLQPSILRACQACNSGLQRASRRGRGQSHGSRGLGRGTVGMEGCCLLPLGVRKKRKGGGSGGRRGRRAQGGVYGDGAHRTHDPAPRRGQAHVRVRHGAHARAGTSTNRSFSKAARSGQGRKRQQDFALRCAAGGECGAGGAVGRGGGARAARSGRRHGHATVPCLGRSPLRTGNCTRAAPEVPNKR